MVGVAVKDRAIALFLTGACVSVTSFAVGGGYVSWQVTGFAGMAVTCLGLLATIIVRMVQGKGSRHE